jgi:hypothetical protein
MTTRKLKALKSHSYGTRRLKAGDEYEVPIREAVALVVKRKAQFLKEPPAQRAAEPVPVPSVPRHEPEAEPQSHAVGAMTSAQPPDLDQLRLQATQLGINVDGRWGVPRLRHEIEIAQAKR